MNNLQNIVKCFVHLNSKNNKTMAQITLGGNPATTFRNTS